MQVKNINKTNQSQSLFFWKKTKQLNEINIITIKVKL